MYQWMGRLWYVGANPYDEWVDLLPTLLRKFSKKIILEVGKYFEKAAAKSPGY